MSSLVTKYRAFPLLYIQLSVRLSASRCLFTVYSS